MSKQIKYRIDRHANPIPSDLRPLNHKAKGLYEHVTAEGYAENEEDLAAVSELAENLRDVLLEYCVSIQKAVTIVGSLNCSPWTDSTTTGGLRPEL